MDHFELAFPSLPAPLHASPAVLCGVVSSGNLEVLLEPDPSPAQQAVCHFTVHTAAEGFRETWQAVLQDFCHRHAAGGLRFLLNDVGATPAVVSLRLAQVHEDWQDRSSGARA